MEKISKKDLRAITEILKNENEYICAELKRKSQQLDDVRAILRGTIKEKDSLHNKYMTISLLFSISLAFNVALTIWLIVWRARYG